MLEWLQSIDESLFTFLNNLGHPYLDGFMVFMSNKYVWFPFYLLLVFRFYKKEGKQVFYPLIALIVTIIITDQVTANLMKPFFERLRPCNDPNLVDSITLVGNCSDRFSFASGHAANSFGLAGFFFFYEKKSRLSIFLIVWAAIVSYSRIYLGVHFPGDVLVGALIGLTASLITTYTVGKIRAD